MGSWGDQALKLHYLLDPFFNHPWAVSRGGPKSKEREFRLFKEIIEQLVSPSAVSTLMGRIIEFNGGDRTKVFRLDEDEIHVFAGDRTKDPVPCGAARTGDNQQVCDANLGEDQEPAVDRSVERFVEFLFGGGEQSFHGLDLHRGLEKKPDDPDQKQDADRSRTAQSCCPRVDQLHHHRGKIDWFVAENGKKSQGKRVLSLRCRGAVKPVRGKTSAITRSSTSTIEEPSFPLYLGCFPCNRCRRLTCISNSAHSFSFSRTTDVF